ncbi:uncharacterized protein LY89DRAFT_707226 [Mollisia scopiformis]|uniref:GH16 domain-containing protein n=1 Tax=Mollisia scopiformis TaxID=149040 RepID=A0A194XAB6_MOLSC|nr:uncharacterized protein LY89DRAFT_707226 [Mollisia scopiformis]KUJ16707.1 hypothetical protein LY89DRAFT_707226 [Mollisia scopiformis]
MSRTVSKLFMVGLCLCRGVATSTYQLDTKYAGTTFFDDFTFFDIADYSHGFVNYVDQSTAIEDGLINTAANGSVNSVRITSNKSWTHGLVILDLAHMPGTDCGSWPAFWMVGRDWPNGGEIDIIEGVNSNTVNQVSLHTDDNCTISSNPQLGALINPNCAEYQSSGCATILSSSSYGTPFNALSGGVYATEWTSSYIRVYYFPRSSIPADILAGSPDPAGWGLPQADMQGNCDVDAHFYEMQVVFDTTFCGDWAGVVWAYDPVCSLKAPNCQTYVAGNPGAFEDA